MATLGPNLVGHQLELVIKGEPAPTVGRLLSIGIRGGVIDLSDDGPPWHFDSRDVSRWRIVCNCPHTRLTDGCPDLTLTQQQLAVELEGTVA